MYFCISRFLILPVIWNRINAEYDKDGNATFTSYIIKEDGHDKVVNSPDKLKSCMIRRKIVKLIIGYL